MRLLSCLFATILALGIIWATPAKAGKMDDAWATCMWQNAPVSSQNWINLGKPGKKMEKAAALLSDRLSYRLKAVCAKTVYPSIAVDKVAFEKAAIWQSLSKTAPTQPQPGNIASEPDPNAFHCNMYFIVEDISAFQADLKSIPDEVLARAPMQIGTYDVLSDSEKPITSTKAQQSNGAPLNLFKKCKRISTNGNLIDA